MVPALFCRRVSAPVTSNVRPLYMAGASGGDAETRKLSNVISTGLAARSEYKPAFPVASVPPAASGRYLTRHVNVPALVPFDTVTAAEYVPAAVTCALRSRLTNRRARYLSRRTLARIAKQRL